MLKILVVDDDPSVAELLREVLSFDGFDVSKAHSGEEGLEMLGDKEFDLVIMDMRMMGLNGIELYRRMIHNSPSLLGRVVFCSGYIDKEMKSFLQKDGIPYIQKPCSVQGIRDVVKNTLKEAESFRG